MANKRDIEPAYPQIGCYWPDDNAIYMPERPGMTLLDYFAGQCLAGVSADPHFVWNDKTAKLCYDMAEHMLQEREKRNKPEAD